MTDWLPDWTKESEYPDPNTTRMSEWAWEFLRRNHAYQKDYNDFKTYLDDIKYKESLERLNKYAGDRQNEPTNWNKFEKLDHEVLMEAWNRADQISVKYNVSTIYGLLPDPGKSYKKARVTFETGGGVRFYSFFNEFNITEKIGIGTNDRYIKFIVKHILSENNVKNNDTKRVEIKVSSRKLISEINLESPIEKQIDLLKKTAIALQQQLNEWNVFAEKRKQTDYYREYLRVLDAKEVNAKHDEIVNILIPNENNDSPDFPARKKINNWAKSAKRLRDNDYIKLAIL